MNWGGYLFLVVLESAVVFELVYFVHCLSLLFVRSLNRSLGGGPRLQDESCTLVPKRCSPSALAIGRKALGLYAP